MTSGAATPTDRQKQSTPNAERTAVMRAKLLDATIECLVERGWAGTSTAEVTRRARVSRGAQVHHFPTKSDLVLAAVEHLLRRRLEEFRTAYEALGPDAGGAATAFDLLREMCRRPSSVAWLELIVAARHDAALDERLREMSRKFWDDVLEMHAGLYPEAAIDPAFNRLALLFAMSVSDGLTLQSYIGADPGDVQMVVDAFKGLADQFIPARSGHPSPDPADRAGPAAGRTADPPAVDRR